MSTAQLILSLILNLFVTVSVTAVCTLFIVRGSMGNMRANGREAFKYFTVQSNVLCALVCLGEAAFEIAFLARGGGALPRWLELLKLMSAAAVGVTCITVLFYLLPVSRFNFKQMYAGGNLFLHALCPLTAMLTWAFLERGEAFGFIWALLGLIPTFLYGALYMDRVLIRKRWEDFYHFNVGSKWYLSVAAMLLQSLLIAAGLIALRGA